MDQFTLKSQITQARRLAEYEKPTLCGDIFTSLLIFVAFVLPAAAGIWFSLAGLLSSDSRVWRNYGGDLIILLCGAVVWLVLGLLALFVIWRKR